MLLKQHICNKLLIVVRGPSGSGKSTIARKLMDSKSVHYETDDFFISPNGTYKFDHRLLKTAHNWNRSQIEYGMYHGIPKIIVSNTSTTLWELKNITDLRINYGYNLEIIRTPAPWVAKTLFERNIHGVPLETIQKQISRYEPYKGENEFRG